jgi:hypothetical protein
MQSSVQFYWTDEYLIWRIQNEDGGTSFVHVDQQQ